MLATLAILNTVLCVLAVLGVAIHAKARLDHSKELLELQRDRADDLRKLAEERRITKSLAQRVASHRQIGDAPTVELKHAKSDQCA